MCRCQHATNVLKDAERAKETTCLKAIFSDEYGFNAMPDVDIDVLQVSRGCL